MPTSAIDSALFRHIFGTEQMRKVWSDEKPHATLCVPILISAED